jgi:hypothetical protein
MKMKVPALPANKVEHTARLDDSLAEQPPPQQSGGLQSARESAKDRNLAALEFEREKTEQRLLGAEARREPLEVAAIRHQLRVITDRLALVRSL